VTLTHVNRTSGGDGVAYSELARAPRKPRILQNGVDAVSTFTRCVTLEVTGWLHRAATLRGLIQCSSKHGERDVSMTLCLRLLICLVSLNDVMSARGYMAPRGRMSSCAN
jgi:hypothetical protein